MRSILVAFILWLASTGTLAQQTLLVFGDSLSAGYGMRREEAWPALLEQRLSSQRYAYKVVNASISGETTGGGRARLEAALERFQPAVVIIELGANDGLRGLDLKQMHANLEAMLLASRAHHAQVLLLGMALPPNYGTAYAQDFAAIYGELARRHKVLLLPMLFSGFADERGAFQADGLHPTAATQARLLDNVWPQLQRLLRKN